MTVTAAPHHVRRPLPAGGAGRLGRGFAYPFEAIGFMNRHRLWGLAAVPVLVNVLLLAGLVVGTVLLVSHEMGRFDAWLAHAGRFGALLAAVAGWLLHALIILLAISVDMVLLILLGRVIAGPFLDLLSERVEQIASGREPPPFALGRVLVGMGMALRDALASLLRWLLLNLLILLLAFVPIVGAFAAVLTWITTARLLAEELVDLPLARRLVPYRRRRKVLRGHRSLMLGFGLSSMLLLFVPLLDLVLLPVAAVGGTLLFCDLEAAGGVRT